MKEHKGMRPQDIVILLKIIARADHSWYIKDLASELNISNSEISESLHRSVTGGLIEEDKKQVRLEPFLEFLVYGLKHVFPAVPGSPKRGMPTAFSSPLLEEDFVVDYPYVWPAKGHSAKGVAINPLYRSVPQACEEDENLYEMLALVDALRVGERNEQVVELLAKRIYGVADSGL